MSFKTIYSITGMRVATPNLIDLVFAHGNIQSTLIKLSCNSCSRLTGAYFLLPRNNLEGRVFEIHSRCKCVQFCVPNAFDFTVCPRMS